MTFNDLAGHRVSASGCDEAVRRDVAAMCVHTASAVQAFIQGNRAYPLPYGPYIIMHGHNCLLLYKKDPYHTLAVKASNNSGPV